MMFQCFQRGLYVITFFAMQMIWIKKRVAFFFFFLSVIKKINPSPVKMEHKKNVFSKLRDKTKPLFNVKRGKKAKKTPLRYRRSISVPNLLSEQAMSSLLDPPVQASCADSFVEPVHSFVADESKCETSSLTDSLTATDTILTTTCTDLYTVPSTSLSNKVLGQHSAIDTSQDQVITPNVPSSARSLDQSTTPYTPPTAKVLDNFIFPSTPPIIISPPPERPAFITVPATKDKPEKRTEDKERNTKWYIEDSESACSTPSEDRSFIFCLPENDLTGSEPISPRSTEMFIIGSAEDKSEVSRFIIFKGFCFCSFHVHDQQIFFLTVFQRDQWLWWQFLRKSK